MKNLFRNKVNISFVANPFYMYCFAFSIAIMTYFLGWCDLYPEMSGTFVLFFLISSAVFICMGTLYNKIKPVKSLDIKYNTRLNSLFFIVILVLALLDVLYMGYIPITDTSKNYKEFGFPVIDTLFTTLSIFFPSVYLQSFLQDRKKIALFKILIIILLQVIFFRRSTIIWILLSLTFTFLAVKTYIKVYLIVIFLILILPVSYGCGLLGNTRSNLTSTFINNELGTSQKFKDTGISSNHYMTYLYISSPLANLQKNINRCDSFIKNGDFKAFIFYTVVPASITVRLEKYLKIAPPDIDLISPYLIVGTCFIYGYYTLGWLGMIFMFLFLFIFISLGLAIAHRYHIFYATGLAMTSTTSFLMIFSNFINRNDSLILIFLYPALFHIIYKSAGKKRLKEDLK